MRWWTRLSLADFNAALDGSVAAVALARLLGTVLAHLEVTAGEEHDPPRVDEARPAHVQLPRAKGVWVSTATTHDTTRHDQRHDTTNDTTNDTTRHDTTRHDTTRHDTTRHDTTHRVACIPVGDPF
jgi:hypothetical protein